MSGCGRVTPPVQKTLETDDSAMRYTPFTEWMATVGLDEVLAVLKARAVINTPSWQLAAQYAEVRTDNPGVWAVLDAVQTGAGERCTGPLSLTNAATNMFVRFGAGYKSSAAATLAQLDLLMQLAMHTCGSVLGTYQFNAIATDNNIRYQAITGWVPTSEAAKVKAALISSGVLGASFQYKLAQQKAATSTESPSAWGAIDPSWRTGNAEACTGDITCSYTNQMWTRFGIAYNVSAGTFGAADIAAIVCVRS